MFLPPRSPRGPAPLLMFMHGNGELADYWAGRVRRAARVGRRRAAGRVPGYGRAPGSPSEKSITEVGTRRCTTGRGGCAHRSETHRCLRPIARRRRRRAARGGSQGRGADPRIRVHQRRRLRGEIPGALVPDPRSVRQPQDRSPSYRGPLLVIHGRHDTIVPIEHGRELVDTRSRRAASRSSNCGHNDCPRQWDTIASFLRVWRSEVRRSQGSEENLCLEASSWPSFLCQNTATTKASTAAAAPSCSASATRSRRNSTPRARNTAAASRKFQYSSCVPSWMPTVPARRRV